MTVLKRETRKARKIHNCCECGDAIPKGNHYRYISGVWDGVMRDYKQCMNCYRIMDAILSDAHPRMWSVFSENYPCFTGLREWFVEFRENGQTDYQWLTEMADMIGFNEDKLNRLLQV